MIQALGLTKVYDDLRRGRFVALDRLTFEAQPGEVYGLLGPNGAGKTTALRVLGTVLQPSFGSARINGFDCLTQPGMVRRQIGVISANTAIYDRMSAWETVEYFGRLHGLDDHLLHGRMEEIFRRLQMLEFRDLLGGKMSTGMKQKVSIARALVHDPPVLVFDEATSGLDVLAARTLLDTIQELRDQGKCVVFSTHIMREAERLCDRIAILHRGRMLTEGGVDDLRERHGQTDLEELFFHLIRDAEELALASPNDYVWASQGGASLATETS